MSNREISRRDDAGELDLPAFETAILGEIGGLGLPTEDILVPVRQRVGVLNQMADVLEPVDVTARRTSAYLSKFMAAVAAGLFDAALNYLWDETIASVRTKAAAYDPKNTKRSRDPSRAFRFTAVLSTVLRTAQESG